MYKWKKYWSVTMGKKVFDAEFYERLSSLQFISNLNLETGMSGSRKSSQKGNSVEFSDFREYIVGDDIRRIDWNAYARTERLYIKRFVEEKEGRFHIVLDCSNSMQYGEKKKAYQALRMAGALAYLVLKNLDRITFTTVQQGTVYTSKGRVGRQAFNKVLMELERVEFVGRMNWEEVIRSIASTGKETVIILSDFLEFDCLEEMIRMLRYHKKEVVMIQILAQEEIEPLFDGNYTLKDMESKQQLRITTSDKLYRSYKITVEGFLKRVEGCAKKYQANYLRVLSNESLEECIRKAVQAKIVN